MASRIPEDSELVYDGRIYKVYRWYESQTKGIPIVRERIKRKNTAKIIALTESNELLVTKETDPVRGEFRTLAGGGIKPDETPLEAAQRELLEETGYSSEEWELWQELTPYGGMDWSIYIFVARNCHKVSKIDLDPGEFVEICLISFEEFLMLSDEPGFRGDFLVNELLRCRLDPRRCEKFRSFLFKK